MSTQMQAEETAATPLHLVFEEDLVAWREQQGAAAQAWIRAQGWGADAAATLTGSGEPCGAWLLLTREKLTAWSDGPSC